MPAKIATSEDLQTELRTLWAMTEEENPSREKLADAISDLASKVAGERISSESLDFISKTLESVTNSLTEAQKGLVKCEKTRAALGSSRKNIGDKRLNDLQQVLADAKRIVAEAITKVGDSKPVIDDLEESGEWTSERFKSAASTFDTMREAMQDFLEYSLTDITKRLINPVLIQPKVSVKKNDFNTVVIVSGLALPGPSQFSVTMTSEISDKETKIDAVFSAGMGQSNKLLRFKVPHHVKFMDEMYGIGDDLDAYIQMMGR
jgi:hypothetical protein